MNTKTIVFCLPGRSFSKEFLQCWTELFVWCFSNGIRPIMSCAYNPNLYYVRNMCLGGDTLRGKDQLPFNGENYDYMMWIDSDIVFSVDQFKALLNADKDIISGLYMTADGVHYATVENMDDNYFLKNGHYQFLTRDLLKDKKDIFPVDYTGFGWILVKRGVFESLEYPWFRPLWFDYERNVKEFSMEDVAFCKLVKERGYQVWIDPKIIVGHQKQIII